jgi:type IX secretion system PorP/SprF family membrane protein
MVHTLLKPVLCKLVLCISLATLLPFISYSQDPSFSQFYANRIYLNPAFTGIESGIAVNGAARAQWLAVDGGFRTYGLTAELQLPVIKSGIALHLLRHEEGLADLNTTQVGLAYSYTIPGEKNNFHFGFEARVVQKSIDWNKLLFSDQLDPVYGAINPTAATPILDQIHYGDLDFGFIWRNEGKLKLGKSGIRKVRSHIGMSFHHLPYLLSRSSEGNDSFLNRDSRVAPRTTVHGGMIIPIKYYKGGAKNFAISPNFKLDMQGYQFMNFNENLTVGTIGLYGLIESVYLGVFYQNRVFAPSALHTDGIIVSFGGFVNPVGSGSNAPRLFYGFSADLNTQGVGPRAGSVFEVTFRYVFDTGLGFNGNSKNRSRRNHRNRSNKQLLDCKNFF